jgi:hypothetical protein
MKAATRLASLRELQARVELLAKMKRYETVLYPETDPRHPVQQTILEMSSAEPDFERLKEFFTEREDWTGLRESLLRRWKNAALTRNELASKGLGQDNILDYAIGTMDMEKPNENARGYRISGVSPLGTPPVMYVVKEDGNYKIIGTVDSPERIGELVLELLSRKEIKSAQWWLDKVVPDLQPNSPDGTGGPAARFLWSGVVEATRGPEAISTAAASLIGPYSGSTKAIQLLRNARARATGPIDRGQIDLALCGSLERGQQWDELMLVARRLEATHPFESDGFRFFVKAASARERWKEMQSEAERRLKTVPKDAEALRAMATSMVHNGNREEAAAYLRKLTESPFSGSEEMQFEAWNSLLIGKPSTDLLAKLEAVPTGLGSTSAGYWYTLGMLQAFLRKPEEAQKSLTRALNEEDTSTLDAKPWALAGKIYEEYGLADAAEAAYQKAAARGPSDEMAKWAVSLAVRRKPNQND